MVVGNSGKVRVQSSLWLSQPLIVKPRSTITEAIVEPGILTLIELMKLNTGKTNLEHEKNYRAIGLDNSSRSITFSLFFPAIITN